MTVLFMANVNTIFGKDWTPVWEEQQAWLKLKQEHEAAESKQAKEVCFRQAAPCMCPCTDTACM